MLEILAPAGNAECANAAINSGANAIYLGFAQFSARQGADNFQTEELETLLKKARLLGVKVYVAMNTLIKDEEIDDFLKTLLCVWNLGVDAIILQDIFLGKKIKETYPEICLHLSTQAGVCDEYGASLAKNYGFSRVILARETPLSEIEKITKIIETEAFVQGALCTAYSGQCYFSSFAGGNSGNRGRCKQPCRKRYFYNRNGNTEYTYALSLSDLSVGEKIEKYIQAGVTSFKIEGRMRRAEYVAAATRYYRELIDGVISKSALSDLKRTYNRGNYTQGLAFGQDKRLLSTAIQGHIGEKVGTVKVVNGKYLVESSFAPSIGDAFKILRDSKEVGGAVYEKTVARGFSVQSKTRLKNGDGVFLTTDTATNNRLLSSTKTRTISLCLDFQENGYAKISGGGAWVQSEETLQSATSQPLTKADLITCFSKTDGLPLEVQFEKIEITGNIFIPKSKLNALRRQFFDCLTKTDRKEIEEKQIQSQIPTGTNQKTAVIASSFSGVKTDIAILKCRDFEQLDKAFLQGNHEKYIYCPAFTSYQDKQAIARAIKEYSLDGVYAENYGAVAFANEISCKLFAGTGFNIFNQIALGELCKESVLSYYAISKETTEYQAEKLAGAKAFALTAGDIKLMELCYCPFGKTCKACDKKEIYSLTDENGRVFPVRRYVGADGNCRFEVYNCANLVGRGVKHAGKLFDFSLGKAIDTNLDEQAQKKAFGAYTSGHTKKGVL